MATRAGKAANSEAVSPQVAATHKTNRYHGLPSYMIPDTGLEMGASLGNNLLWVNTKGSGMVDQLFSVGIGTVVMGSIAIRYSGVGNRLIRPGKHNLPNQPAPAGSDQRATVLGPDAKEDDAYVQLEQEHAGTFELHPAFQRHQFELSGHLEVCETTFLPKHDRPEPDPPVLYQVVELCNRAPFKRKVRVFAFARMRGATSSDLSARFDEERTALVCSNQSAPACVRVFGCTDKVAGYETTFDASQVFDIYHMLPLSRDTSACGAHMLGALEVEVELEPDERR